MKNLLEICIDSAESAMLAEKAGADRLELCENLIQGGVTPSMGKIEAVLAAVNIPVRVLIRPRAGNFQYSTQELNVIYRDIELVSQTQTEGIVIGALGKNQEIEEGFLTRCNALANGKKLIFHRAFDLSLNPLEATRMLIKHGFDTVLTSGQKNTAEEGVEVLAALQREFGSELNILAGGGVRSNNIKTIHERTGITQFHSSAKVLISENSAVSMSSSPVAEQIFTVDSEEIMNMKQIQRKIS